MAKGKATGKKSQPKKMGSKAKMMKKTKPAKGGVKQATGEKRTIRFKPGTVALREIKRYQKSIKHLMPRAPFVRLVRNICNEESSELRFASRALMAL